MYTYYPDIDEPAVSEMLDYDYSVMKDRIQYGLFGGTIEHVSVLWTNPDTGKPQRADMFVDEDFGRKNLPFNKAATDIYLAYSRSRGMPDGDAVIKGIAIVFDRIIWS